ncbi:MAG: Riboflavin biosynthesis protein RibF [Planctomycetes bacterium]|nr:Riboflavin biosynthesis protein RibF [Planctomycetota bacterium]
MRTLEGLGALRRERFRRPAVTLGVFDGVHRGHRAVLARTREMAARLNGEVVVVTFHVHPKAVTHGEAPPLVTSLRHRLHLLRREGVDTVAVLRFDRDLREMGAEAFADDVLAGAIGAGGVVAGHDTRFGRDRRGDAAMLRERLAPLGVLVESTEPVRMADGEIVSSSAIRAAVARGDLARAGDLLGRPPALFGTVVRGDGRGRSLGFPTANLDLEGELRPGRGVYGGVAAIGGERDGAARPCVVNIGGRPTFHPEGSRAETVEAHVPDWEGDLYGRTLEVFLLGKLRDERRFDGPDALRAQIAADIAEMRRRFRDGEWRADVPGAGGTWT